MGKNSSSPAVATPQAAPVAQQVAMQNFPAFQGGQQGLLAQQMSQGYGATPQANMGLLSNLYHDVSMPMIERPDQIEQYLRQLGLTPSTNDVAGTVAGGSRGGDNQYQPMPKDGASRGGGY